MYVDLGPRLAELRGALLGRRWREAFDKAEECLAARRDQCAFEEIFNALTGLPPAIRPALPELRSLARRDSASPWPRFVLFGVCEGLRSRLDLSRAAEGLRRVPRSHAWMKYFLGMYELKSRDRLGDAARAFREALAGGPGPWKARAYLAEIALCRGRAAEAFAGLDPVVRADGWDVGEALAWRGSLRLWHGDYRAALEDLDAAAAREAPFALGWRGAAKLQLGRTEEALEDLDACLRRREEDDEARVWRSELHRRMGRPRDCLRDLDRVLDEESEVNFWARANRGLALAALGERAAGERELARLPPGLKAWLRRRAGTGAAPLALLEAGLRLGRGLRRPDPYLQAVWMGSRLIRT